MAQTKLDAEMSTGLIKTTEKASKTALITSSSNEGKVVQLDSSGSIPAGFDPKIKTFAAQSADPATPTAGKAVMWLSDGVATGDTGDLIAVTTRSPTVATYTDAIDFNGFTINDSFNITVPADAGGTGVSFMVITEGVDATGSASALDNRLAVGCSTGPSAGTLAETVVDAINGHYGSGGAYNHAFASANTGVFTAAGVTATLSGSTKVTLTSTFQGANANAITVANVVGNAATNGSLSGAVDSTTVTTTLLSSGLVPDASIESGSPDVALLSTTVLDGTATEVLFTTEVANTTYSYFEFIFLDLLTSSNGDTLNMQTSSDKGVSYDSGASDYKWATEGRHSQPTWYNSGDNADSQMTINTTWGNATSESMCGTVKLYSPGNTKRTRITTDFSFDSSHSTSYSVQATGGGARLEDAIVNAVRFFATGNLTGTIKVYGYK